jgi:hypothetical protein
LIFKNKTMVLESEINLDELLYGALSGSLLAFSAALIEHVVNDDKTQTKSNIIRYVLAAIAYSAGATLGGMSVFAHRWQADVSIILVVLGMLSLVVFSVAKSRKLFAIYIAFASIFAILFAVVGVLTSFDDDNVFVWRKAQYCLPGSGLFLVSGATMITMAVISKKSKDDIDIQDEFGLILMATAWTLVGIGGSLITNKRATLELSNL